ncbi:hypothetical protein C8J57DRAFT_1220198 [Mycena rebaudengoi]|nr:hypothetical protein C8J57DRAFT_1220198 [Mycena rebaudengoi]
MGITAPLRGSDERQPLIRRRSFDAYDANTDDVPAIAHVAGEEQETAGGMSSGDLVTEYATIRAWTPVASKNVPSGRPTLVWVKPPSPSVAAKCGIIYANHAITAKMNVGVKMGHQKIPG